MSELRPALIVFALLSLLTGFLYPLVVTGIGQAAFSTQVNGDAHLLGQAFSAPRYFWSRPSATAPHPYNGAASSGSNQGPLNPALATAVKERIAALRAADPGNTAPVPVDLVTASASGLDPHISPEAAEYQVARVARARKLPEQTVRDLVDEATLGRTFGILGEPRVNVLELNLSLDALPAQ
jgi:K+-transporting ATPase ATPase C chain